MGCMQYKTAVFLCLIMLILLSACITQQQPAENTPQNEVPEQQPQTQPEISPASEPNIIVSGQIVSGEFNLKIGDSIKNLRGTNRYQEKLLELRVKSVIYRFFPMSKIGVFEVLDETGTAITQRDSRVGRYLNEDLVSGDSYEPVLLDKIYVKDIVVSEGGNSIIIEVNK